MSLKQACVVVKCKSSGKRQYTARIHTLSLKPAETSAQNKVAQSSFLSFCQCLIRQNILQRDGNMLSCRKRTSVLQTVLLLLLFLALT